MTAKILQLGLAMALGLMPAAMAAPITGLTATGMLVTFDSATPGTIGSSVTISGLVGGDALWAIDYRPATGQLYGMNTTGDRLYVIDAMTGVASQVGIDGLFSITNSLGFDFNPVVDRLRVISSLGQNLRINPNDATAITDGNINPSGYAISGAGYTNNFAGTATTTLYGIDGLGDRLVIVNPPNAGTIVDVGALGFNAAGDIGFDITTGNVAYLSAGASGSSLYTVNLTTGAATLVGSIGNGLALRDIALPTSAVPEPATGMLVGGGLALVAFARARRR